jgi:hypothetical protein
LKNKIIGLLLQIKALAPFFVLISKQYPGIDSPYGYGEVLQGYVDTALLLKNIERI